LTNFRIFSILALTITCALLGLSGCASKKDIYKGLSADEIYSRGQGNVGKENYAEAIKDFEALEARFPYGVHSHEAQLALISSYHKRGESALALSAADRFIRMNPRHAKVDYAHYLKGLVNFDQNATFMFRRLPLDRSARDPSSAHEAFDAFRELLERFPNSQYAEDARQRMVHLKDQLARHELTVVDYYMRRGAYLSAANRANYIVKNFDQTSTIPDALRAMVISYQKLGMTQLAEDAYRTLQNNFPKSEALKGLKL
jgi:outer membrane protein assembly factor BamD